MTLRQEYHDWQQTCQCGEAVYCPDCQAAWVVGYGPEPEHIYRGPRSVRGEASVPAEDSHSEGLR